MIQLLDQRLVERRRVFHLGSMPLARTLHQACAEDQVGDLLAQHIVMVELGLDLGT